ncbi:uncharacterized protein LOC129747101 isoform X2 [Uranotaenia lowii]|uniref:uncharacterized protein LOC129747101 isoform X2 n=1 Tax=Uranotaenia lowii TaxID=190385 RepID=UPI0024795DB5|nr:uncharacterized protein LOC129747101 isoform X2 [Uranotaenia lowii]
MSKSSGTPSSNIRRSRLSRDSGICLEDGNRSKSLLTIAQSHNPNSNSNSNNTSNTSAVKKRFPAGGGGGGVRAKSSYVHRLTQHFENLTCHQQDDFYGSNRSSPTSTSLDRSAAEQRGVARYHSDWSLSVKSTSHRSVSPSQVDLKFVDSAREGSLNAESASIDGNDSVRSVVKREVKMDNAIQVIESIYEEVLVERKRSSRQILSKSDEFHPQSLDMIDSSNRDSGVEHGLPDEPLSGDNENLHDDDFDSDSDEITESIAVVEEAEPQNSDFEIAQEATELPIVAEARNTQLSHSAPVEQEHGNPYLYDDDFSDTDSFDSTDDEEREIVMNRPDSNTSIKSERITRVMKELLENEESYVNTLARGIENYISIMQGKDLPPGLRGQRYHIFGNIEHIHELHKDRFLPRLRHNRASIKGIAETFIRFIEQDRFYCYILFALNRPKSEKICNRNLEFFQVRQQEVNDKLGLNSFLLQPIQRLPRYKLMLGEINKEVLKLVADEVMMDTVKDEIGILCKAEKRLERFIDVVNEAMSINDIQECYEINLLHQGKFRKMFELDVYDWDRRRRYPGKVFFFEKCIIYTEKLKDFLEYRGHYVDSEVGVFNDGKSKLCVFSRKRGIQEVEFSSSDVALVQRMAIQVENVMKGFALQERERINDLSRKKDWVGSQNRIPSVVTINRGSVASTKSSFSMISNNSSRDSYESTSQTTWDSEKPIQSLVSAQKHFCQILTANRKYYFDELPAELSAKIQHFIEIFDQLLDIHTRRVYEDLSHPDVGIDEICELFLLYFKEDLFKPYYSFVKHFKKASGIMKNIHKASRISLSDTMVVQTTDEFAFLPIDIWNKYLAFIQTQIVNMSEQMNENLESVDKELFRKLAFVEVQVNTFRKSLLQNFRLFNLDEKISAGVIGLVTFTDRVRYGNETLGSHRILLCEQGCVCVKIQLIKDLDRQVEKYTRVVFVDRFKRDAMAVKISKKLDVRLNFEIDGMKHAVDFGSKIHKDKFYGHYCMNYSKTFKT